MPQQPIGLSLTAKGNISVTRSCAVNGCGVTINAPARLCNYHWMHTPAKLREEMSRWSTAEGQAPVIKKIVDHWARA